MPASSGCRITLDISRFIYSRYFYSFVKFLQMEGVAVDLRFRAESLHAISRAQYGQMVLSERLVSLGRTSGGKVLGDQQGCTRIEPFDFTPSRSPGVYDIPMAQHPLMYSRGLWDQPFEASSPRAAILFVGNSEPGTYGKIDSDGVFDVIGRIRLREILVANGLVRDLAAGESVESGGDGVVTLVDSSVNSIPMESFRQTVACYSFFLCAPGVFMPLCHNLVEAMSVGSIPVIQRAYAEILEPVLEHGKNAILFEGENDLADEVKRVLGMGREEIAGMRAAVLEYYQRNLTPRAVVARVLSPETGKIRMLAGERSVDLLRQKKAAGNC
jgi:hypothetical protein